jgi:thiosulfate/3-mercaptopyruvate sulfurtransferase
MRVFLGGNQGYSKLTSCGGLKWDVHRSDQAVKYTFRGFFVYICIKSENLHMKNSKPILIALFAVIFANISMLVIGQTAEPWTSKDLMEPQTLVSLLGKPKAQQPVIFNIGPVADIKGAINIGSTASKANLDKLSKALAAVPKDKMVVIYCGCCPFRNCPNIRPAFALLKERGYQKAKLLNLKQNLKVDWTDYGYPME